MHARGGDRRRRAGRRGLYEAAADSIARLQARGLADPALDQFVTGNAMNAMNAMVSRMASLVFVYGLEMSFDALAEMLLQLWVNARRIPGDYTGALAAQ